ncbi:MAG: methyltransferase domain-containing protein, partial [Chitinophagaceae bacterium]
NVIENNLDITSLKVLDIFGGTGSISYEMASRGCMNITTVEKDQAMFDFIKRTTGQLSLPQIKVIRMDVFKFLEQCTEKFDFIFAGPPYALSTIDDLPLIIFDRQLLNPGGWFVLEHTPRNQYEKSPHFSTSRKYGTTIFTIFVNRKG